MFMADYLQHIVTRELDLQSLLFNHSVHLNHLQCEFLGFKLHLAVEQAKSLIEVRGRFPEDYTPVHLLRAFYWQVEGAVTLVEKFCEKSWLSVAAAGAQAIESFALACQELQWFTALFENLCSQSETTLGGILELAGQKETMERVATLAYQDGEALKLKLGDVVVRGSPSEQALAQNLLQKLQNVGREPRPDLWTLDARELILGKFIGRGSTGIVYNTTWLNATHALKVFSLGYREIFEKEVAILAGLNHPHVLPMIGCAVDLRGNCMLVVELMDEGLDAFIARKKLTNPLPLDEALNLMLQIGEGVKYLHQQGIVHRDLKSSNILVKLGSFEYAKSVRVKVADFGISKRKERSSTCSPLTMHIGTTRWMAPEILGITCGEIAGDSDPVKMLSYPFKVDIYGYALICYEILTGREPYGDLSSLKELKRKVKDENLRPTLPPSCPLGVAILLQKCWDANPKTRPSFKDICKDLRHMLGLLLSGHSSIILKPMSEVLNTDIPNFNHILSMNAGRT